MPYKVIMVTMEKGEIRRKRRSMIFRPDNQHETNDAEIDIERWIDEQRRQGFDVVARSIENFEVKLKYGRA